MGYQQQPVAAHGNAQAGLGRACALYRRFFGQAPDHIGTARLEASRPRVLVELGELRALVYRAARGNGEHAAKQSYVHYFDTPPRLLADPEGQRLFIAGGRFRVTRRGIEG